MAGFSFPRQLGQVIDFGTICDTVLILSVLAFSTVEGSGISRMTPFCATSFSTALMLR